MMQTSLFTEKEIAGSYDTFRQTFLTSFGEGYENSLVQQIVNVVEEVENLTTTDVPWDGLALAHHCSQELTEI